MASHWLCLPLAVAWFAVAPAHAAPCDGGHMIDSVTGDGSVVVLEDGSVWSIDAADQPDVAAWTEATAIAVCDGSLVNEDDHETADAEELRGPSPVPSRPVADPTNSQSQSHAGL